MKTFSLAFVVALAVAAALAAGRYTGIPAQQNGAAILFVMDRFTGDVSICGVAGCQKLAVVTPRPAPAAAPTP